MNDLAAWVTQVWNWWTGQLATQQPAAWGTVAVAFLLGVVLATNPAYRVTRHLVTYVHEAGHAVVGILTGRRLAGIRLHTDSSGSTTTAGTPGVGQVLTSSAGYPAPAVTAGLLVTAALTGHAVLAVTVALLITGMLLLFTRNLFGLLITMLVAAGLVAAVAYLPPAVLPVVLSVTAGLLAAGAARDWWTERHARPTQITDVRAIAVTTHVPAPAVWVSLGVIGTAGLLTGPVLWVV